MPDLVQIIHIVPRHDLYEHETDGDTCWCCPERDEDEPHVLVHNSADGREDYETGRRKPH